MSCSHLQILILGSVIFTIDTLVLYKNFHVFLYKIFSKVVLRTSNVKFPAVYGDDTPFK